VKCLVTGAAGFIGSHLSEALIGEGNSVLGVDCLTDYYPKKIKRSNLSALRKLKGFEFAEADLALANLRPLVKGIDAVFHLAAQPGVRASWGATFSHYVRDNIVATQRLLEALKAEPVKRFVYASSSSIYGESERMPTPEDVTPRPISPYGATKLAAEHLCHVYYKNYDVRAVTLRYFTVYGPRQRPDMAFSRFISRISGGEEIEVFGDGEQERDFTFVEDIVAGNILALGATPGSAYNVGAGKTITVNEVITTMERIIGKKAKVRRMGPAPGDVRNTSADITRISRDLGYRPRTGLAEGLRKQVEDQTAQVA
jgi:UDP-glucuronate 4-epimerase